MKYTDTQILTCVFGFLFLVSLSLNLFYLTGCNNETAEPAPHILQETVMLDLSDPKLRYAELMRLYNHAEASWRITSSSFWERETAYANIMIQIISILEMRDTYPVEE